MCVYVCVIVFMRMWVIICFSWCSVRRLCAAPPCRRWCAQRIGAANGRRLLHLPCHPPSWMLVHCGNTGERRSKVTSSKNPWMQSIYAILFPTPNKLYLRHVVGYVVICVMCIVDMTFVWTSALTEWNAS